MGGSIVPKSRVAEKRSITNAVQNGRLWHLELAQPQELGSRLAELCGALKMQYKNR